MNFRAVKFSNGDLGNGVDIVETVRFNDKRRTDKFLTSIFSDSERRYSISKGRPEEHFAARFAAKEATCKALAAAGFGFVSIAQVVVIRDPNGTPSIFLRSGRNGEPPPLLPANIRMHVSLSHSQHYATATVIVEAS